MNIIYLLLAIASAIPIAPKLPGAPDLKYFTESTKDFWVNKLPDIPFDIPESYAGLLPISNSKSELRNLFFWFMPTTSDGDANDDLVIWLNGGPGCSSLEGFIQENGPISWQPGTYGPVYNKYTWINATNMVWVDQPVGTGFSTGIQNISSEEELAEQFLGFFEQFIKTFGLHKKRIYVTGESYAGTYVPYITNAMYKRNDTDLFDVRGMWIVDPVIATSLQSPLQDSAVTYPFVKQWNSLFGLNDTTMRFLEIKHETCGYRKLNDDGQKFPPAGTLKLPDWALNPPSTIDYNLKNYDNAEFDECDLWTCKTPFFADLRKLANYFGDASDAITMLNPCFDIYHVTGTCPFLADYYGTPEDGSGLPDEMPAYFDRKDVQAAINAPNINWKVCSDDDKPVFTDYNDSSAAPIEQQIPEVVAKSKRTLISHGLLDFILIANGTLLAIQNMTWGGLQGFQAEPKKSFIVGEQGDMGVWAEERGLTYVTVKYSGHMMPRYQPAASYKLLLYLLDREDTLS